MPEKSLELPAWKRTEEGKELLQTFSAPLIVERREASAEELRSFIDAYVQNNGAIRPQKRSDHPLGFGGGGEGEIIAWLLQAGIHFIDAWLQVLRGVITFAQFYDLINKWAKNREDHAQNSVPDAIEPSAEQLQQFWKWLEQTPTNMREDVRRRLVDEYVERYCLTAKPAVRGAAASVGNTAHRDDDENK